MDGKVVDIVKMLNLIFGKTEKKKKRKTKQKMTGM